MISILREDDCVPKKSLLFSIVSRSPKVNFSSNPKTQSTILASQRENKISTPVSQSSQLRPPNHTLPISSIPIKPIASAPSASQTPPSRLRLTGEIKLADLRPTRIMHQRATSARRTLRRRLYGADDVVLLVRVVFVVVMLG